MSSKIFLICIIGHNRLKEKFHRKILEYMLKAHHYAYTVQIWAHFLKFELILAIRKKGDEEISIFSNSGNGGRG